MYRIAKFLAPILLLCCLCGCSDITGQINVESIGQQIETIAQQVDVESMITTVVENIDWEELKGYAQQGYGVLVERFPALKSENIKVFLKENGLDLMNRYLQSTDETMQDNARKLGEIIKILSPELSDEVDAVIAK